MQVEGNKNYNQCRGLKINALLVSQSLCGRWWIAFHALQLKQTTLRKWHYESIYTKRHIYIYICVRTKYKADLHFIYAEAEHVGNF